ncbi:MAG: threonine--tRNA ligase [Polyangiaceae bacterium]
MSAKQTPREILKAQGKLDKMVVAVRIGDKTVDLHTPVDPETPMTPIKAFDPLGLDVIRHSTAHVMADAVQRLFPGTKVTFGPAVENGFYYDFARPEGSFSEDDLKKIEETMKAIVKKDSPFRREVVSRDAALELFRAKGETFKVEHIGNIPASEDISLYRHGGDEEWVDLCEGPHVPSTGFLKALKLMSVAGAYWRGDEKNPMLQRIYGTAFSSQKELDEYLKALEDAKARDHRKLGKELELFHFDPLAPAMPFFLPKGAFVYNKMIEAMRSAYEVHGYEEVISPQVYDPKVFRTSGHLGNYNENMYRLWTEDLVASDDAAAKDASPDAKLKSLNEALHGPSFALKPMNCPGHCVLFGARRRSYRELPWRIADFGRLHRYERGGVVHGLSRVRTFCQDDAHIFCTPDQVASEIEAFIRLLYDVYEAFKFTKIDVKLATRPEKRIGSDEEWDRAEHALQVGLEKGGIAFEITPGEGAFYGPKIEFHVQDALKRSWQLGTIQYDPNLPARFELGYIGDDGKEHMPIMLHRAVFGSLERFFSVYLEHTGGNFPTWIAPRQALVVTVLPEVDAYANEVLRALKAKGIRADIDASNDKLGAKIRNGRLLRYPYICVVGGKEVETRAVNVRSREKGELGAIALGDFLEMIAEDARPPVMGKVAS